MIPQSIASSYVEQWQKLATSSTGKHLTLAVSDLYSLRVIRLIYRICSMEMTLGE